MALSRGPRIPQGIRSVLLNRDGTRLDEMPLPEFLPPALREWSPPRPSAAIKSFPLGKRR